MNRADAYALLSRELQAWQCRPYAQLLNLVDQPPAEFTVRLADEDVIVRITVGWANQKKGTLRVHAIADGPSCWRLERLEESIIVSPERPPVEQVDI